MIEVDDALRLLGEVVRQWKLDAQRDERELHALAAWLEVRPDEARRILKPSPKPRRTGRRTGRPRVFDDL